MKIIKLDAIDSTNSFLKELAQNSILENFTIVTTNKQENGRGQQVSKWISEPFKNLTFSIFIKHKDLKIEHQKFLNYAISLSIYNTLERKKIKKLSIKWPNDILSVNKKICGILIENNLQKNLIKSSIIGIGLNVNQTDFKQLPNASSLKILTGRVFNLDELLQLIQKNLKYYFKFLERGNLEFIKSAYENRLFRKDKPSSFKDQQGNIFAGFIKGINDLGNLQILLEDDIVKVFDLKEVTLLY